MDHFSRYVHTREELAHLTEDGEGAPPQECLPEHLGEPRDGAHRRRPRDRLAEVRRLLHVPAHRALDIGHLSRDVLFCTLRWSFADAT